MDKSYYVKEPSFFFVFFLLLLPPQLLCLGLVFPLPTPPSRLGNLYTPKPWECPQSSQQVCVIHLANSLKG